MIKTATKAALAFALIGAAGAASAQDAANGEKVFRACQACHVPDAEQNRVGPHLVGVVGRDVASVESFAERGRGYSDAMQAYGEANGGVWTPELLDTYLAAPMEQVQGTYMAYPGVKDDADRADLIAYLETL